MGYKHNIGFDSLSNDEFLSNTSGNPGISHNMGQMAFHSSVTPSGMREDILLASWLIVLLRTREGERVTFEWAYESSPDIAEDPCKVSMEDVMKGLQDSVDSVTRTISSHISTADSCENTTEPASLLLSTNLLEKQHDELMVRSQALMRDKMSFANMMSKGHSPP